MTSLPTVEALPSFREILNAAFKDRRKIVTTIVVTVIASLLIARMVPQNYEAHVSLLVLPSPEYSSSIDTGVAVEASNSLSRSEVLPTEIEILNSPTLHEETMREIGLGNIYPKLVRPPGLLSRAVSAVKKGIHAGLVAVGLAKPGKTGPSDPIEAAEPLFANDLSLIAEKDGAIIQVSFRNPDAEVAANTLNTLIANYLEKRHELYSDNQSGIINAQVVQLRAQLEDLDQSTAAFKLQHSVYDFDGQRSLLLTQRGDLEKDLGEATNVIAQLNRRIPEIQRQLQRTSVDVTEFSETDYDVRTAELRTGLNTLLTQKASLLTQFRADSRPVQDINNQIATVQAAIEKANNDKTLSISRVGRNNNYDLADADLSRALEDLRTAQARHDTDLAQLASIGDQLDRLSGDEAQLEKLDRMSKVAEQSYEDAIRRYDLHKEMEEMSQRRAANIRPIEPAVPPLSPTNLTIPLLGAGLFVGIIFSIVVALISEARRPGIISPEKLERTLGLTVLVSVPEAPFIAEAGI